MLAPELILCFTMLLLGLDMVLNPAGIVDVSNRVNDALHRFRSRLEWPHAFVPPEPAPCSPATLTAIRSIGASVVVLVLIFLIERL
jgi:hypothetical protein